MRHRLTFLLAGLLTPLASFVPTALQAPSPTFSNPLEVTNTYFPLPELGKSLVKKLAADDGTWEVTIATKNTRTFEVAGQMVEARELIEIEFLWEWALEASQNYFAQADDGSVYYFGEVVTVFAPAIAGEEYSWLVGGAALPGDPRDTIAVDAPALFMPAEPKVGMTWKPEDAGPEATENALVLGVGATFELGGVTFEDCLVLHLSSGPDDAHVKLYAPGYGEIFTSDREVESSIVTFRVD